MLYDLARTGLEPLLPRERQVLAGVQNGLSNQQIADSVYICEDTVKYHLKRIFAKLGVSRRSQAVAVAVYNGLLDDFVTNGGGHGDAVGGADSANDEAWQSSGESESHADC
jgi:DNA-binding CsgD family transcriptional regulator